MDDAGFGTDSADAGEQGNEDEGAGADGAETDADGSEGADEDHPRFDVGDPSGGTAGDGQNGCKKADFLFVVDNSGSMQSEQAQLVRNFPTFMDAIRDQLPFEDFHVMALDVDALGGSRQCHPDCVEFRKTPEGMPTPFGTPDCPNTEAAPCHVTAEQWAAWDECDKTLGSGVVYPLGDASSARDCGLPDGRRYLTSEDTDLTDKFACIAQVGIGGTGDEQSVGAALAAVSSPEALACNTGFLRPDAVLVVTFVTDEDTSENNTPSGGIAAWKDALVAAKGGNEDGVVIVTLGNDMNEPNPACVPQPLSGPSERLYRFSEQFKHHALGSICAPSYDETFVAAAEVVGVACDEFVPPG